MVAIGGRLANTFEQFLVTQPAQISISYLIVSLVVAAVLSWILGKLYVKYGTALSNRKRFASNFVLLATTTTLIINVIKSSLALSLGMVGALSIIRFRSAIKEPEELAFLFLAVSIGLGLGANQLLVTIVAFLVIAVIIWARHLRYKKDENQNLYLTISGKNDLQLRKINDILKRHCNSVHLKRLDKTKDNMEASFLVDFESYEDLEKMKAELEKLSKSISISYLDKIGLY